MRLSPWHLELAKRVAQGQPNRDIMKEIQVSGSRLSVLKANPLFASAVSEYRRKEADKYAKAVEVFADKAQDVAKEITHMATSALVPPNIRLQAGQVVLDRLAMAEGVVGGNGKAGEADEVVFEQLLRVTRRGHGDQDPDSDRQFDTSRALEELNEDLQTGDIEMFSDDGMTYEQERGVG